MKRIVIILITAFTASLISAQQITFTQTVKGTILDEQSGNVLSNASVVIEGISSSGDITDSLGNFKLKKIPIGRHTIKVSLAGYEEAIILNIEVTSSKEVVLEIKLRERIIKLEEVVVRSERQKSGVINDAAKVSARQLSMDEAVRYAGTRNDPSRMAQNFAGVSGGNDARNDIIIRGNSPSGILWRMEGIDIPNPNHYSTLGSTGGPVTILNTNTLKNSDFITSAFPAQYGNAIAGVFDLRMRNGNNEKLEFFGQAGFNGLELGGEGPIGRNKASFLINYHYSLVPIIQKFGLSVGTGSATPYYQDINFKLNIPTKKAGTFSLFGLGGESHINFAAVDEDNLYSTNDGSLRDRTFRSMTGATGLIHQYFFDPATSGKIILAVSGFDSKYSENFFNSSRPDKTAFYKKNTQVKYSAGYTFNKKINSKNQLTTGVVADFNKLKLRNDYIPNGDSVLLTFIDTDKNAMLLKSFINYAHRFSDKLSSNMGVYYQLFSLNNSQSIEPRWNIRYQFKPVQSISFGAGLHSQAQPLEVYFYQSKNAGGQIELTNKDLGFVKSVHGVLGYDINFSRYLRLKAEVYGQYIYNAAVEKMISSFSMLNAGADFYFPDKTNLVNNGKGYNYGLELTLEKFLEKGFYYLFTGSLFNSKYQGSDQVWRNSAFNSNFALNFLGGKEFPLNKKISFGIDSRIVIAGGQRYTPFDVAASDLAGYVVFKENEAYSLQNETYLRWDFKLSYKRNGKKTTQKWFIDLQNLTGRENIYIRTLNPNNGKTGEINQIGFFPNVNYMITF